MGTPDFAVASLRRLVRLGHQVIAVYSQPPKPAGRGYDIQKSPVNRAADELGIAVYTPETFRHGDEQRFFSDLNLDLAVVAAYGLILPSPVLTAPKFGCINIHASLLPRWRGAAPIQRAILEGDRETGITIMQMEEGLDTGAILMQEKMSITPTTTAGSLQNALCELGARMIEVAIDNLASGNIHPRIQPKTGVTYAPKLVREDGHIDWGNPAGDIERQIRGLQPWPGCFFMIGHETIKVLAATVVEKVGVPGTLLDESFTVAAAQDALRLQCVQRAGKKPTDGASLLRGLRWPVGHKL